MNTKWKEALDTLRRAALEAGADPRAIEVRVPPELFVPLAADLSRVEALLSTEGVSFRWRDIFVECYRKQEGPT